MTTYGDDLVDLTRAVGRLTLLGLRQPELHRTGHVLAARDAVWRGLRSTTLAAAHLHGSADAVDPSQLGQTVHPSATLAAALAAVLVSEDPRAATGITQLRGDDRWWRDAAAAAVSLERHTDALRRLDDAGKQTVQDDMSALALAMTHCEDDLRRRCAPVARARARLLDAHQLAEIRHSAATLQRAVTTRTRPEAVDEATTYTGRALFIHEPAMIPAGLQRLSRLWADTREVAIKDIVLTASVLQHVTHHAASTLQRVNPGQADTIAKLSHAVGRDARRLAGHRRHFTAVTPGPTAIDRQCRTLGDITRSLSQPLEPHVAAETLESLRHVASVMYAAVASPGPRLGLLVAPAYDDQRQLAEAGMGYVPARRPGPLLDALTHDCAAMKASAEKLASQGSAAVTRESASQHLRAARSLQSMHELNADLIHRRNRAAVPAPTDTDHTSPLGP